LKELRLQGLYPDKVWEPVQAKTVMESINLSFKSIVSHAKVNGWNEVIICEDDLMFPSPTAWDYFISNKPTSFDIYIAGNYLLNRPEEYTRPHYKLNEYVGNQLIIVSSRYYDRFLEVPVLGHIDTIQRGRGEFYACWPMAALQRPGFSSNSMCEVNYNSILKPEWIYDESIHNIP
jgi:hypothetical protein